MKTILSGTALALFLSGFTFVFAESDPAPSTVDPRIRYLTYERDQVYRLRVAPNRVMTIVFDTEENITSLQVGDSVSWQIELLDSGNVIVIKLQDQAGETNLTAISESGRIYSFDMLPVKTDIVSNDQLVYRIHFNYPDAALVAQERREREAQEQAEKLRIEAMQRELDLERRNHEEAARIAAEEAEKRDEDRRRRTEQIARQTAAHESEKEHQRELQRLAAARDTQLAILREQQALEYTRLQQEEKQAEATRLAAAAARDAERRVAEIERQAAADRLLAEKTRLRDLERINAPTLLFDDGRPSVSASASTVTDSRGQTRRLSQNELFLASAFDSDFPTSTGTVLAGQDRLVAQGTIIQAVLETAVNSDLPGMIRGIVNEDVFGFDGTAVMIPKGARLIGRYSSNVALGQERVLAVWTRLIRPDGTSIALGSPASDDLGVSGLSGDVDTHFGKKFGSAALVSVLAGISGFESARIDDAVSRETASNVSNDFNAQTQSSFERYITLAPTIRADQGSRVSVFVARDLYF